VSDRIARPIADRASHRRSRVTSIDVARDRGRRASVDAGDDTRVVVVVVVDPDRALDRTHDDDRERARGFARDERARGERKTRRMDEWRRRTNAGSDTDVFVSSHANVGERAEDDE